VLAATGAKAVNVFRLGSDAVLRCDLELQIVAAVLHLAFYSRGRELSPLSQHRRHNFEVSPNPIWGTLPLSTRNLEKKAVPWLDPLTL
jgi:hypothetical protein